MVKKWLLWRIFGLAVTVLLFSGCIKKQEPLTTEKWQEILINIDEHLTKDGTLDLTGYLAGISSSDILNPEGEFNLNMYTEAHEQVNKINNLITSFFRMRRIL